MTDHILYKYLINYDQANYPYQVICIYSALQSLFLALTSFEWLKGCTEAKVSIKFTIQQYIAYFAEIKSNLEMDLRAFLTQDDNPRLELLPLWIRVFTWIFIVAGLLAAIALILSRLNLQIDLNIYGIKSSEPRSHLGLLIITLFLLKAVVGYALWTGATWAINLGIVDGVLGVAICIFLGFIAPFIADKSPLEIEFRLELLLLIPYLIFLFKTRRTWLNTP